MAGAADKAVKAAADREKAVRTKAPARSAKERAQEALDTANRKIERANKRKAEALATMQTIGAEIAALVKERDYLAAHPALQESEPVAVADESVAESVVVAEQEETADRDEATAEAIGDGTVTEGGLIDNDLTQEREQDEAMDVDDHAPDADEVSA